MQATARARAPWRRIGRYAVVGAVSTALHYALLAWLVEAHGWPAWAASGAGAVAGAQLAFAGNRWFTFADRGPVAPAWLRFQGTALLGALWGMAVVALGVAAGAHYLLAQAVATLTALLLTFAINRQFTFREPAKPKAPGWTPATPNPSERPPPPGLR